MAYITEQDRIMEFQKIKDDLEDLQVASEIVPKGVQIDVTSLVIALPTTMDEQKEEEEGDLHIASAYILQIGEEEEQMTKYLLLFVPIRVDITAIEESRVYALINDWNQKAAVGNVFMGWDKENNRNMVQIRHMIGALVTEEFEEAVVCEAVFELGAYYDEIKGELLRMAEQGN